MFVNLSYWALLLLAGLTGTKTVHAFTASPRSTRLSSQETCMRLSLAESPEDALALLKSASESVFNIVSQAESPSEVLSLLPRDTAVGVAAAVVGVPAFQTGTTVVKSFQQLAKNKSKSQGNKKSRLGYVTYPEGQPATYEMNTDVVPFEFGDAAFVRPLLKQTQLEARKLQVVYDANRHGYDAQIFHSKVDGKGAAVVLAKVEGQWCGGYNPRGWASLGQPRSSVASFLFRKTMFGWGKIRCSRTGSMACGNDMYDAGIYFGPDSLVIPLRRPDVRLIKSRLGQFFEPRADGKLTLLPRAAEDLRVQELKVLTGVYAPGEDIPNSGGVLELGQY